MPPPGEDEAQGDRTDLEVHPAVEVPRPFTRETLESEESEVKDGILRMGSLVAERIVMAIDALENHDAETATWIIENDHDRSEITQPSMYRPRPAPVAGCRDRDAVRRRSTPPALPMRCRRW